MDTLKLVIGLFSCHYLSGKCLWSSVHVQAFFSGIKMAKEIGKNFLIKIFL
jgi:hypothetical protein